MREIPLGQAIGYPDAYDPEILFAVPRSEARNTLGLGAGLPFRGADLWNAWELTWLDPASKPVAATAEFVVDATSPNIIESKSLKLYLNSFAMTRYESVDAVAALLRADLSRTSGGNVLVNVVTAGNSTTQSIGNFPGECIDHLAIDAAPKNVDADLLRCQDADVVNEELHSHLLRSNCPVTNQPDIGSVLIRYCGPKIDHGALLRYIVSYRQHSGFHESCVEQMFLDIKKRCLPVTLTVYARYNRRGGLDINPFRTDSDDAPDNIRLWRQ